MAYMLSTSDNPYNPFKQFNEWYTYDTTHGYNTLSYLARIALTSNELTEEENQKIIDQAVNEIIDLNLTGNYVRVYDEDPIRCVQ